MGNKTYAIGDLHGRYDLLLKALNEMTEVNATVVFLGDYIDRGPDSEAIVSLLRGGSRGQRWVCLRGNHEDMMIGAMLGDSHLQASWVQNGGYTTIQSYGEDYDKMQNAALWMSRLKTIYSDKHRVFVHAAVKENYPLENQPEACTQWMRYDENDHGGYFGKHVVHGHTPFKNGPIMMRERTNLDVGAHRTGRIVIAVFDDDIPGGPERIIEVFADGAN